MPTQDISRYVNQPAKHYTTVQMQQGRVILDSDWNERAMSEAEDLRATLLDITCSYGTPNDGYEVSTLDTSAQITPPNQAAYDTYDFAVAAGSFYIGGLRVVLEDDTTFLQQKDWLQIDSDSANVPERVTDVIGDRFDLVYLRIWEQTVSGTEDAEIAEVALGGRDTSVRVRRMQRIQVKSGLTTPSSVSDAFSQLVTELSSGANFNPASGELISTATLTVSASVNGVVEDPCAEPTASGYVGANNRAIRIELRGSNKLIWGYDNASPLYRVTVDDANHAKLVFLNEPADLPSMPRAGQIVELLQWGARLDNGEKVAERQGMLSRVATTYDPTSKELILETEVSDDWVTWLDDHAGVGETKFLFLRLWDQGGDVVAPLGTLELDYSGVGVTDLGSTGLAVDVPNNTGRPGDYWIIAARPSTPDLVTPWKLLDGEAPHGPREYYAPLAVIFFDVDGETITPFITDGRLKMRPLCESGCAKVSVGDNKESFGQVSTLQDAIDLLGATGGKICVLPGKHIGTALVDGSVGANDIIIEGCGPRSVLKTIAPSSPTVGVTDNFAQFYDPVLRITDAARVQIRDLRIEAHSAVGISVEQSAGNTCEKILIDNVQVFASGDVNVPSSIFELAAPGIAVMGGRLIDIVDCEVEVDNVASVSSAIVLGGDKLRLHRTRVIAPEWDGIELRALGGVQVRSCSQDVEIVGCEISGGWGHGIALGHADKFTRDETPAISKTLVLQVALGKASYNNPTLKWDCLEPGFDGAQSDSSTEEVWLPMGPVEQVRIHDNVIRNMGMSGISTSLFFSSQYNWQTDTVAPVFIVAIDLDIARNLIEDNVKLTKIPEAFSLFFDTCVGGICLAASICATIRENRILRNGSSLPRVPICGIGLVAAQAVTIEDNRIVGNGAPLSANSSLALRGLRGGIAIYEVAKLRGYTFKVEVTPGPDIPGPVTDLSDRSEESALVVRGNKVSQPLGKALWVRRGFGPISVTGNTLESFGDPVTGAGLVGTALCYRASNKQIGRPGAGACVEIVNYAKALDVNWTGITSEELSWTDVVVGGEVDGGNVLVAGNMINTSWSFVGGYAASVLVSSLANVVFESNVVRLDMQSTYDPGLAGDPTSQFNGEILEQADGLSFCVYSSYVGAKGAVQVIGNRFEDGKFDCVFSCVAGPAIAPVGTNFVDIDNAVVIAGNITTHPTKGQMPSSSSLFESLNVAIFVDDTPTPTYTIDTTGGDAKIVCVVES
jgi:hypothetical protein